MRHLNYNHLLYFWTVANEGSVARAAEALSLTPQTISGQLKTLEQSAGGALFERAGRGLTLTATGQFVYQYADEIFRLGGELALRLRDPGLMIPNRLKVGMVSSIPKLIAYRTLAPALTGPDAPQMTCREADLNSLLADLALHRLDLVLSDQSIPTGLNVKAYSHLLGYSDISWVGSPVIARRYSQNFPRSLDGAPCLLPTSSSVVRRHLDDWFERQGIQPRIVAEFDDSALMKAVGEAGHALYPVPSAILTEVWDTYGAESVGRIREIRETYFAITPERKLKHPKVIEITETARDRLFNNRNRT
ncbi:transcriptional activator NhaR [Saccharospirillum salsuginis]|uniref:Transcriptional activator NhaR n=1 Tax=Saccharospirillum salsuginis TaxID=418750 RepID=A0A918N6B7_9GAMM|nr:transcriptional activator NhaR [Saccharospirillum salsuginis]GGX45241.1 transcriptional activator NhaR [Saccharospirillum salsuginis]